ncbi:hypothetical protein QWJ90_11800 [Microbacterium oryzae]|uniref:hypothetical protein n=1 Tax=Microbacterium oryzae TaxID=743009 RepID=UPI0025AF9B23|nr:hypothetical protein [Microbacterium oryzae]MDN3311615.1 hypothetical protein [Microbacterium oryzae]
MQGVLSRVSDGMYSFARSTPGSEALTDQPLAILTADRIARRGDILLMQWGRTRPRPTRGMR